MPMKMHETPIASEQLQADLAEALASVAARFPQSRLHRQLREALASRDEKRMKGALALYLQFDARCPG